MNAWAALAVVLWLGLCLLMLGRRAERYEQSEMRRRERFNRAMDGRS